MMPEDPMPGNGDRHRIRGDALLLPASLRYDWQHSSSQLPVTFNDARWISSPSGRDYLRQTHGAPSLARQNPPTLGRSAQSLRNFARLMLNACKRRMGAIPIALFFTRRRHPIFLSSVGRRSPPPNVPDRIGTPPPPRLPIETRNARRISSPAGVSVWTAPNQRCIPALTFVAESPDFGQNFAKISS